MNKASLLFVIWWPVCWSTYEAPRPTYTPSGLTVSCEFIFPARNISWGNVHKSNVSSSVIVFPVGSLFSLIQFPRTPFTKTATARDCQQPGDGAVVAWDQDGKPAAPPANRQGCVKEVVLTKGHPALCECAGLPRLHIVPLRNVNSHSIMLSSLPNTCLILHSYRVNFRKKNGCWVGLRCKKE